MKCTISILVTVALLALSGCGGGSEQSAHQDNTGAGSPAMKAMPPTQQSAQAAAEHSGEGTLNSIDKTAGTVNITHGPVASANWPGMTMSFKLADPAAVPEMQPGQRIKFQFTIQGGMVATVTKITPE